MSRMQAEAERDGANGVVGVGFEISNYAWGMHTVEFYAAGTRGTAHGQRRNHHAVPRPADERLMSGLDSGKVSQVITGALTGPGGVALVGQRLRRSARRRPYRCHARHVPV